MADDRHVCTERRNEMVSEAIFLMKQSLALLDTAGAGCTVFGCHLSMAIDTAEAPACPGWEPVLLLVASDLYH